MPRTPERAALQLISAQHQLPLLSSYFPPFYFSAGFSLSSRLQLSLLLNLPGTKGSVPDPARSCREKLPRQRCLSLRSPSLAPSLPRENGSARA